MIVVLVLFFVGGGREAATEPRRPPRAEDPGAFDAFAGGYPVPPMPGQRRRASHRHRAGARRRRQPITDGGPVADEQQDADAQGTVLGPGRRVRGHLPDHVPQGGHRAVPRSRSSPTAPRFHGRHQLNRWPDGLEKCIGCELCAWACPADAIYVEGASNTDDERFSPGRALRPRLPDQLPALHPLRAVHRGVPDPGADDDQRVRAGRQQPRRPDLREVRPAGAAAARHGAAAAPDAARRRTRATTTAGTLTQATGSATQAEPGRRARTVTGTVIAFWVLGPRHGARRPRARSSRARPCTRRCCSPS